MASPVSSQGAVTAAPSKPELLAPAGGRPQLEAAVRAGADAVYFGLRDGLNARIRAASFDSAALDATMDYLHERGVRGYLTLNTLVFDDELERAETLLQRAAQAGVDAVIVQDVGLARLARATAPDLPLHASTQMSITDAAGVAFARQFGIRRVVIGRELSIDEIARVVDADDTEIEVFVHGALCVSYSGQCYSSEAWGGRSANRGQCAQACRLPYGLLVDGHLQDQGDLSYLLSPQDLMALELLPRLVRAGVHSLKIEGRLKGPEYVAATVSAYRAALDRICDELATAPDAATGYRVTRAQRRRLAQVFSRGQRRDADGLTPGFLDGPRHQSLVIGRSPRHRGLFIGEVAKVTARGVIMDLDGPVKPGDGVVFDRGRPEEAETGGNVHRVCAEPGGRALERETDSGRVRLTFGPGLELGAVGVGDLVWRTRDSALDRKNATADKLPERRVPVDVLFDGQVGSPLALTLTDPVGRHTTVTSRAPLQAATGRPLDEPILRKALGTLGDTPLRVGRLELTTALRAAAAFLPPAEIKSMRRAAIAALLAARRETPTRGAVPAARALATLLPGAGPVACPADPCFSILCRTVDQVDAALHDTDLEEIALDFLEVHGLKEACARVRRAGRRLVIAAPRILKPGESRLWQYLCRLAPDALLVRSAGLLWELQRRGGSGARLDGSDATIPRLHGDFSLNAANVLAATRLLDTGLARLALTHDLDARQACSLAGALPPHQRERIEVIAHHHLPVFHTEHCVFARFLSQGDSYRDCGRPCEKHRVHLRDPAGGDHLVQADVGCRNTVFNAAAQSAGGVLDRLRAAGIRHYRIELVDEPAADLPAILAAYREAAAGRLRGLALWQRLGQVRDANGRCQGAGPGSLAVRVEPLRDALKKPTAR